LIMGGPFVDGSSGMVVFEEQNTTETEEIFASDPTIVSGIFKPNTKKWSRIVRFVWKTVYYA